MIYLVRHGETEFNVERRLQGALDSPLTPLGIEQGKRLGRLLSTFPDKPCRIVASPLGRAQHTARLIREHAALDCEIVTEPRLAEISFGKWDGQLRAGLEPLKQTPPNLTWYFSAPGGETYEALIARLKSWLDEAMAHPGPTIAVSHGVSTRILRGLFLNLSQEATLKQDIPQDACFRLFEGAIERIAAL